MAYINGKEIVFAPIGCGGTNDIVVPDISTTERGSAGLVYMYNESSGLRLDGDKRICIASATEDEITEGKSANKPIVPATMKHALEVYGALPKGNCIILVPGATYVLKQEHNYFIHGYGDNCLQVLYSATGENALPEMTVADDIDARITSTGDGTNYWQMFYCYLKDSNYPSTDVDGVKVSVKPVKFQQFIGGETMVKNIHATGNAYIYEQG